MTIFVASVPANPCTGGSGLPFGAIAASRSQTSDLGTAPRAWISRHMPASKSPDCREGTITADKKREKVIVITTTGKIGDCPYPTGIGVSGNHRSNWAACPGR